MGEKKFFPANPREWSSSRIIRFMRFYESSWTSIFGFVTLLWPFMASCQITKTLILFFKGHLVQGRPESLFGPQSRGREARYARDAQVTRNYYNWLGELHLRGWKQSGNGARPHRIVRFVFFKIFSIFSYQEFMSHFCVAVGLQQFRGMLFPNKY